MEPTMAAIFEAAVTEVSKGAFRKQGGRGELKEITGQPVTGGNMTKIVL